MLAEPTKEYCNSLWNVPHVASLFLPPYPQSQFPLAGVSTVSFKWVCAGAALTYLISFVRQWSKHKNKKKINKKHCSPWTKITGLDVQDGDSFMTNPHDEKSVPVPASVCHLLISCFLIKAGTFSALLSPLMDSIPWESTHSQPRTGAKREPAGGRRQLQLPQPPPGEGGAACQSPREK